MQQPVAAARVCTNPCAALAQRNTQGDDILATLSIRPCLYLQSILL